MKIKDQFLVTSKEVKTGTSKITGKEWEMTEYVLQNELEREDGSIMETFVPATAAQSLEDLVVGGKYNLTLFISSRSSEKDGKTSHWVSFRITNSEVVSLPSEGSVEKEEDKVDDDIPF